MYKFLTILLLVGLWLPAAPARDIYCNSGTQLLKFDSATPGNLIPIGATGISDMFGGLEFGPGPVPTLYGYTEVQDAKLYSVDRNTGHATLIGGGGMVGGDVMTDMAWDPVAGVMYAIGQIEINAPTHLYRINLNNGYANLVGTINVPKPSANFGLAVSPAGVMYMEDGVANGMYRVDGLSTTFMGNEGFDFAIFDGFTIDWLHGGTWYHGAYNQTRGQTELWTVDPNTGAGTFVGRMGDGNVLLGDLAIIPAPEPASVLLLALAAPLLRRTR